MKSDVLKYVEKKGLSYWKDKWSNVRVALREHPDMMSASEGGHGKADVVREVA